MLSTYLYSIHILRRKCLILTNPYRLQHFKILPILLSFNFTINLKQALKGNLLYHIRYIF